MLISLHRMNRRGFLTMLAGATLDPERLLWTPGRKLISIPRYTPRSPIQQLVHEMFLDTMGWAAENPADLAIWMKSAFAVKAKQIGDTLHVRQPSRFGVA